MESLAGKLRYDRFLDTKSKNLAPGFVPEAASFDTIMKASLIYVFAKPAEPKKK